MSGFDFYWAGRGLGFSRVYSNLRQNESFPAAVPAFRQDFSVGGLSREAFPTLCQLLLLFLARNEQSVEQRSPRASDVWLEARESRKRGSRHSPSEPKTETVAQAATAAAQLQKLLTTNTYMQRTAMVANKKR